MIEQTDLKNLKIWKYLGQDIAILLQERMLELDEAAKSSLKATLLDLETSCEEVTKVAGEDVFEGVMQEALLGIMDDLVHEVNDLKKECYEAMENEDRSNENGLAELMLNTI